MGVITTTGLCALLAAASATLAAAPEPHRAAQDLRYGESLYHYYTGDLPQALSVLLRAEHDGGITKHQHYPQLMRAGMYLAYGMDDRARAEFAAHLGHHTSGQDHPNQNVPQKVRDTAHYYLAQLDYRAGDYAEAAASAVIIGDTLSDSLGDNLALLNAHLLIKAGPVPSLQEAQTTLSPLQQNRALALLNLGNAAARAGDPIRAQHYYQAGLATDLPDSASGLDEALAVRDKTLTALGYSFLQLGDYASAKAAFRDVRLDSNLANSALLGYGWAAASYHDYVLALKPWQALRNRSLLEPAVQETLLAVPWAYEQLKAPRSALIAYRESEQLLTDEFTRIKHTLESLDRELLLASLRRNDLQGALLTQGDGRALQSWLTLDQVNVLASDSRYLQELLKRDALQDSAQQLRDLLLLQDKLNHWQVKLDIYRQLIADKRQLRGARADQIEQTDLLRQHQALREQREQLAGELTRIAREQDTLALADPGIRAQARRIHRARTHVAALAGNAKVPANATERLDFYQGLIAWRAAQDFADQQWRANKTLAQLDSALDESRTRSAQVAKILTTDPDLDAQVARLTALQLRNDAQLTELNQAVASATDTLLNAIRQGLVSHRNRLQDYLAQVHLSTARLFDVAYRAADNADIDAPKLPEVQE
ncbi:hypothetical protein [Gilvimarinus polysaccharolyticus]|uniref:hypothetical protein n=1 Tax=Gilvimarinus polysaccharolyticus TaxID=863921 RepID=UPI0006735E89|nr:hypothetical protein [Gilvimarinus polysaccharolyticus]